MSALHEWKAPELARALDADAIAAAIRRRWDGDAPVIERAQVVDVRYRPDRPTWLLYRLRLRRGAKSPRWQLFAGRLIRDGETPPSPPATDRVRAAAPDVPTAFMVLDECHVALYAFPLDEALPGLPDALNDRAMATHLAREWADPRMRIREVRSRSLGYTPWARAAIEYEVLAERGHAPELRRFIGKLHAAKPASRRFADAWAVWRAGRDRVGLAPPVGYLAGVDLTLQEQVRGVRLGALVGSPRFTARLRQAAPMLAALHGLSVPVTTRRTPADEVANVERWSALLLLIRPDLSTRITALRDELAALVERHTRVLAPIHADFHHANLLVDGDRMTIIDFDEMALGDPLVDVGRFLASLRIPALRAFRNASALDGAGAAFLDAYLGRAPHDVRGVRMFEAAALLTSSASAFRIQRPRWKQEVEILLHASEQALGEARGQPVSIAVPASPPERNPSADGAWVRDPFFMRAALDPLIRDTYGATVVTCRADADAGRDRFPVAVHGWMGEEPWRTTLEISLGQPGARSICRRLHALRRALSGAPDAPRLPRAVGAVVPIDALVLDVPHGTTLADLLAVGSPDAIAAAEAAGRALARIHQVAPWPAPFAKTRRPARSPLAQLAMTLRGLPRADAGDLLEALSAAPDVETISLRRLGVRHITWRQNRVAFVRVDGLGISHPLLDAADVLATLALTPAAEPHRVAARAAFVRGYESTIDASWTTVLPAVETALRLRRADRASRRTDRDLTTAADRTAAAGKREH